MAARELESPKHRGLISLFDREFVAPREVPQEHGRALRDLFSARILGDYRFGTRLDAGTGRALFVRAEALVGVALSLLGEIVGSAR